KTVGKKKRHRQKDEEDGTKKRGNGNEPTPFAVKIGTHVGRRHAGTTRQAIDEKAIVTASPLARAQPTGRLCIRALMTRPGAAFTSALVIVDAPAKATCVTMALILFSSGPVPSMTIASGRQAAQALRPEGRAAISGCPSTEHNTRPSSVSIARVPPIISPSTPGIRLFSPKKRATNSDVGR